MKSELQIQHFLSQYPFKTKLDWRMISLFCTSDLKINLELTPEYSPDGLTVATFTEWYNSGIGCGEIRKFEEQLVIIGKCGLDTATVAGILNDEKIEKQDFETHTTHLLPISEEERELFLLTLLHNKLQLDRQSLVLVDKYIPKINERVIFYNDKILGLGVVRGIDVKTGEVELYCYSVYQTGEVGYSMHEKGICTLHEYYFEPMAHSELKQMKLNASSCQRRLNRDLEKHGKIWKDKLHRIEPLQVKVEIGQMYWYIDDKMKIVRTLEKGTPTSRYRYQAGNYFTDFDDCMDCLKIFVETLRDNLAKPEKPTEGK